MNAPRILSLFSGIGGIERGFALADYGELIGTYENWEPARTVLRAQFGDVDHHRDIRTLTDFHGADVVTAGFPCTDLSQAGRTTGLDGPASGLVRKVLETLTVAQPDWLLIENVPNMLHLTAGRAIREIVDSLEECGYDWAYRVIDSRSFGLAQRRRRVYLMASREHDPAAVLFRGDADATAHGRGRRDDAFGFSWTEGNRGIGWARDAVPTLKGSTTVRVPSPPAVWRPEATVGSAVVTPSIEALEVLQGFPVGWTDKAPARDRWKLVGNAVSVPVARWIVDGMRSVDDGFDLSHDALSTVPMEQGAPWPRAACSSVGKRWRVDVGEWPVECRDDRQHLADLIHEHGGRPLSYRATAGFRGRLLRSSLRQRDDAAFVIALDAHLRHMAP